jgi:hypothetical protein
MELAVREMGQLPSGLFHLGAEHPLRFRGLANNAVSAAPQAPQGAAVPLSDSLGDGPVLPAVTPAPSGGAPAASSPSVPAQAAPQGPDLCVSVRNCFNSGAFAADIQNISSSVYGRRHHILRYNVRIRNASAHQLVLAYTHNSLVTVDNLGQRYGATSAPNLTISGMSNAAPGANPKGLTDTSKQIVDIFKKK